MQETDGQLRAVCLLHVTSMCEKVFSTSSPTQSWAWRYAREAKLVFTLFFTRCLYSRWPLDV